MKLAAAFFLFATVPVEPAIVRGRVCNCPRTSPQLSTDKSVKILRTWSATVRNYPQLSANIHNFPQLQCKPAFRKAMKIAIVGFLEVRN